MTPSDGQPQDNTGRIIAITVAVVVGLLVCCVVVAVATIVILALLGPAIGNVFSSIITPTP